MNLYQGLNIQQSDQLIVGIEDPIEASAGNLANICRRRIHVLFGDGDHIADSINHKPNRFFPAIYDDGSQ